MAKQKPTTPRVLFGNRVLLAIKPPEVSTGMIAYAVHGAFGNPSFREGVIVQLGSKVVEDLKPGDKVCWNGGGGVPFKGMIVVSVLDLEFKIAP